MEQVLQSRLAVSQDLDALVRVINRAYRVEAFFAPGDRTDAGRVRERLTRPGSAFLVLDDPARPGSVAACVWVEVKQERGYFGMLAVDPDCQGRGLARLLIGAAERHCRTAGCQFLDISVVNLRTELFGFYRQFGFAPYATAPFHEPKVLTRPAHLVLLTKPLVALWEEAADA